MATNKAKRVSKKRTVKKAPAKRATKKVAKKVAKTTAKKAPAKKAVRAKIDETRKLKATKGQEHHFYNGFPRGQAYAILVKAPKQTMKVSTFLDKVEKLAKVKSRKQARGIVQKLVGKPGDDGTTGAVAHYA